MNASIVSSATLYYLTSQLCSSHASFLFPTAQTNWACAEMTFHSVKLTLLLARPPSAASAFSASPCCPKQGPDVLFRQLAQRRITHNLYYFIPSLHCSYCPPLCLIPFLISGIFRRLSSCWAGGSRLRNSRIISLDKLSQTG